MQSRAIPKTLLICCCLVGAALSNQADAQFLGHNFTGDMGLMSGSQAPPGWWLPVMYLRYDGDTLRGSDGESIAIDPAEQGALGANAYVVGILRVTEHKIFGGNYGFGIFPAFTDNKFEVPILTLSEKVSTGFTDLYIQPINLGWTTKGADFTAGLGVYAPTGSYDVNADDNLGLGMWSFEIFGGTTLYFDQAKTWNFALTAFYETHTKKKDTDLKVGDILTVEGGLGKSFLEGAVNVGIAYYGQWKVTEDHPGEDLQPVFDELGLAKHQGYGIGPEVNFPIATKKKLIGMVTARYFWESGVRSQLEGKTFTLSVTFPIPSIPLQ